MMKLNYQRKRAHTIYFDPTPVAGLRLWYDASDESTVTLNGSRVSALDDKSGNGDHLTQATAGIQPLYVLGAQNGLNGILYNSTRKDKLARSLGTINQPHTVFVVANTGGSGNRFILHGLSSVYQAYKSSAVGQKIIINGGSAAAVGSTVFGSEMIMHTLVYNAASSLLFLNRDVNPISANPGSGGILTGLEVGASGSGSGWSGHINEIRLYNELLTVPEREQTWDQLIRKWGI